MIFSNIKNIDLTTIDERIKFCVDYFNEHDLINYNAGTYQTDREDICFRIDEYETQIAQERYWQAHEKHIDVYILLKGQERIDVNIYEGVIYHRDKIDDMLMLEEMPYTNINFLSNFGDILVCNPNEAHKTGIHMDLKNKFKIEFNLGNKKEQSYDCSFFYYYFTTVTFTARSLLASRLSASVSKVTF